MPRIKNTGRALGKPLYDDGAFLEQACKLNLGRGRDCGPSSEQAALRGIYLTYK